MAYAAYVALSEAVPAFWRLPAKLGDSCEFLVAADLLPQPVLLSSVCPVAMDARTAAALAVVLREANCAAVAEIARLRQAVRHARQAVLEGNRTRALHRLAQALNEPPPRAARGHLLCGACGVRASAVWQLQDGRELCRACYRMRAAVG